MTTDALDPSVVSKSILHQIEHVTCIECCKYFIAPKTAVCGHSLCHNCWSGRRSCPICEVSVNRKSLKLNLNLQSVTDHVNILSEAFETLFNVKLKKFTLDIPEMQSGPDPSKHVKEWLACSENNFSAPVSSQQSQDIVESVKLSSSKIQIHTGKQKKTSTKHEFKNNNKNALLQTTQENWDKIEILPDTEDICTKDKENIVGPIDIEPFYFEDNNYTTDNPRRSSRKRELKHDSSHKTREPSVEKQSSKNSDISRKVKQTWNNVKKMKKEFSKLNRDKSKLNVSIEMLKKSQRSAKESQPAVRERSPKPCYEIDDNTPNNDVDSLFTIKQSRIENKGNDFVSPKTNVKETSKKCANDVKSSKENMNNCIDEIGSENYDQAKERIVQNRNKHVDENNDVAGKNKCNSQDNITNAKPENVAVIKKSSLLKKSSEVNCIEITQNDVNPNSETAASTDDVEISIRIGSTITNIVIKKKPNDVQLQINTDREIQTSLGPYGISTKRDVACSPMQVDNENITDGNKIEKMQNQYPRSNDKTDDKIVNTQGTKPISAIKNIESAKGELQVQASKPSTYLDHKTDDKINKTQVTKSTSSKKNTESADTATANFEITESVEKELSDIMDCVETKAKDQHKASLKSAKQKSTIESTKTEKITNNDLEEAECVNDIDIFNSGSVKENNFKSLQSSNKALSEILVPTLTNKGKKSQKVSYKRDREANNDLEVQQNKKQKVGTLNGIDEDTSEESRKHESDSEHTNYDAIMSQVFANIDADIKNKTQSRKENSNKPIDKDLKINSSEKTRAIIKLDNEKDKQQKYSVNIFTVLDKDSEVIDEANNGLKQVEPDSTQKGIENLLTPGICRDLVSFTGEHTQKQEMEPMDVHMGTPLVDSDDSDKSVVEETPQKNVSFIKQKQNYDPSNKSVEINKEKPTIESKDLKEHNDDSQIIISIINITDTEESGNIKDTTVINAPKRNTLETPLTINKFADHIKHNSTPFARKSLNFDSENIEDFEQTLCSTTTQEKEFMAKAFEPTPKSPAKRPLGLKYTKTMETKKFCLAGSCLTTTETAKLKLLCSNNGWTYVDKYTKDITHLVVGVDKENKSQRSVKYMCALAASKWIVSYGWVEKCLITKQVIDELPFEALDACGEPGPQLSRLAPKMLFDGISFYCMSPFGILDIETLKYIVEAAGGLVVNNIQDVKVTAGCGPALLLAEPEHTLEDRFTFLAVEHSIVPVNYEWVLNCLGSYTLCSISDLLLCSSALLPPATREWPAALMQRDSQDGSCEMSR